MPEQPDDMDFLDEMERDGLVEIKVIGGRKHYRLTQKGHAAAENLLATNPEAALLFGELKRGGAFDA